jgi:hypothetical protein
MRTQGSLTGQGDRIRARSIIRREGRCSGSRERGLPRRTRPGTRSTRPGTRTRRREWCSCRPGGVLVRGAEVGLLRPFDYEVKRPDVCGWGSCSVADRQTHPVRRQALVVAEDSGSTSRQPFRWGAAAQSTGQRPGPSALSTVTAKRRPTVRRRGAAGRPRRIHPDFVVDGPGLAVLNRGLCALRCDSRR